jgi:DNA replicative helicase MCM subunit Mcm2 (Cdc46/Mcm family)
MNHKKRLGTKISALLLIVALMLPTVVKLLHVCEDHAHITRNDQSTQIHKTVTKCDTCSFHLASFSSDRTDFSELIAPCIHAKLKVNFASQQYCFFINTNTRLRAPPVFS